MSAIAYPWLRLQSVSCSPWVVQRGEEAAEPLDDVLPLWDYAQDLVLTRMVTLDPARAAAELGACAVRMLGLVTVGAGQGRRRRTVVWRQELPASPEPLAVEIMLRGAELSQELSLTTELLLLEAVEPSPLSPVEPMARLWAESVSTVLDPESRRFPMEATSFATLLPGRPGNGAWYLDWTVGDIDRPFTAAVRLYVNADQPEFVSRVSASEPLVMQMLTGAMIVQLSRGLLDGDALALEMAGAEPETLGGTVAWWLQGAFPNQSLDSIRALSQSNPALFEACLISAAGPDPARD